jgi:hypothetical protein
LANELGKYWKVFGDRYVCSDGQFYPNDYDIGASNGNVFPLQHNLSIMILQQGRHSPFLSLIEQCHYQSTKMQIIKNCVELSPLLVREVVSKHPFLSPCFVFFFISLSLVLSFRHKVVDFTSRALE